MRILLTANASYVPPRGGATRSNMIWLDHLARHGHQCRIVSGISGSGAELRHHDSIAVLAVEDPARRVHTLRGEIRSFRPDWVLVSSEDLGHALLREAQHSAAGRVVYLAHTPQFFPFGPASWNPDRHAAEFVAQAAGIVAIGRHMAAYIEQALGRAATVIHPPIYGAGPFPRYENFGRGRVIMINPSAVKGISIFLSVARHFAAREFGVLPGWGTTSEDRRALERLPNVRFLKNEPNIDDVLADVSVLLMPSLWYEGFGLIAMEAMLRGIPVVSSDSGGLVEAKAGTRYVIPAKTITEYEPVFDELAMPKAVVEENDPAPWHAAIGELLTNPDAYRRESERSRAAGLAFMAGLDAGAMERYLAELRPVEAARAAHASIESLTPEKRALLLQRLHKRQRPQ